MFTRFRQLLNQQKQIDALRQDFDEVRRITHGLEIEWSDMHDRFRRQLAKLSKRDERETARLEEEAQARGDGDNGTSSVHSGLAAAGTLSLSSRQQQLNAQILARRNKAVPQKEGE